MNIKALKRLLILAALLLAQVLVLNNIHLFGVAIPLLYVYFILMFRNNFTKWAILLWAFGAGLVIDIFSNTPGVATGSMTLIGALQPYVLKLFAQEDSEEDFEPSVASMGSLKFTSYTVILVFVYCITFFSLETFDFFNWSQWIQSTLGSTILTTVLILTLENMRKHHK